MINKYPKKVKHKKKNYYKINTISTIYETKAHRKMEGSSSKFKTMKLRKRI
jgi:hypothetical protein